MICFAFEWLRLLGLCVGGVRCVCWLFVLLWYVIVWCDVFGVLFVLWGVVLWCCVVVVCVRCGVCCCVRDLVMCIGIC